MVEYDSVVVGGGVMGYSTALALATAGQQTVLVEQFPYPHSRGSSAGHTRITRVANSGTPEMNAILVAALEEWKKIQKQFGEQILVPHPMLCIGRGKGMDDMKQAIFDAGSSPITYTMGDVNRTYGFNFPVEYDVFADPEAAVMLADRCLLALKTLFEQRGGTVLDQFPVVSVDPQRSSVVVHGPSRSITASRAVICAGPWTGKFLKQFGLDLPLVPEKIAVQYWRQRDAGTPSCSFILSDAEVAGEDGHETTHYYGLPSIEYPGLVKICDHEGVPCDPDARDLADIRPLLTKANSFIGRYFPSLYPQAAIVESCIYTVTPDREMILDTLPGCPHVAYCCGFSGTGFKLAPLVGQLLCQLVTGQPLDYDIIRFRANRFNRAKY